MDALCLEVGEEPPSTYALEGELHPVLLLHWRVQAYLVGHLDPGSRREYRGLLPGLRINGLPLRAFTMNRRLPPQTRRVVVEGWTPEATLESPLGRRPRKRTLPRRPPVSRHLNRTEHRPLLLRTRRTPGGGPTHPRDRSRGRCGPLALRRVHLTLMYEW